MVASLTALGAIGVDTMLPALPEIGARLGVGTENERQYVIAIYLIGLGAGQLLHGPLADRFGRRPVMMWALAAYGDRQRGRGPVGQLRAAADRAAARRRRGGGDAGGDDRDRAGSVIRAGRWRG